MLDTVEFWCNLITMTLPADRWPYFHEQETATLQMWRNLNTLEIPYGRGSVFASGGQWQRAA